MSVIRHAFVVAQVAAAVAEAILVVHRFRFTSVGYGARPRRVVKKLPYMLAFVVASGVVHAVSFVALRAPQGPQLARVVPAEPRPAPTPPQKKTEAPPADEPPMQPTVVKKPIVVPPAVVRSSPVQTAQLIESAPIFVYGGALRVKSAP